MDEVLATDLNLSAVGGVIHVVSDAEASDAGRERRALLLLDSRSVRDEGLCYRLMKNVKGKG